ncbi:MAG TPA: ABC transporter permease [Thermoanaerobaculia bacterium]|nr:ABC transporter permease [Thermoanaerobaculia bacterium]
MNPASILALTLMAGTPLLLAVTGELMVQKGGMINIALEAMMLMSAFTAALIATTSNSVTLGFVAGVAGGALIALAFGFMVITLGVDQIVSGTALNLLTLGITGVAYQQTRERFESGVPSVKPFAWASGIPIVERLDSTVLLAWVCVPCVAGFLLWRTRFGLRLRACGENSETIEHAGLPASNYRWSALAIEAFLAGIAGAYLSLSLSPGFAENMVAGRGFIALAIVIFGRWTLRGVLAGVLLFSLGSSIQFLLQANHHQISFHLFLVLPYLLTLAILVLSRAGTNAPAALGKRIA